MTGAMIDFYYWPTPNGWKITIALEEMNLPDTTHLVNIGKGDQFKPDFLSISPNNRMPAIVDHNSPTAHHSPSLKAVPSCNTSRARRENSMGRPIATSWRSTNG